MENDNVFKFLISLTIGALIVAVIIMTFSSRANADILSVATQEIGRGEQGGNNKGKYVREYLNGKEGLPWCAGFVSYCCKKAGLNVPYLLGAKSFLKYGQGVSDPKPGDIIVFSRQGGGHVGIVEKVTEDSIVTIEGNTGEYPSVVKRISYQKGKMSNLLAYRRIE